MEYLDFHFTLSRYPRDLLLKTRLIIESGALPEAMKNIAGNPQLYKRLLAINDAIRKARNTDAFIQADLAFHRALIEASGIEPLMAFSGLLEIFFRRYKKEVTAARRHWRGGIDNHAEILKAIHSRDLKKAQHLLESHLRYYKGHL
jgi:DNA-binding GntR family transcriptional regulator